MYKNIKAYCDIAALQFSEINPERKAILAEIAAYINQCRQLSTPIQLMYVCTHNSRRSHFGQVWAAVAAAYYGIGGVHTFSGGTEATALHPNAIKALKKVGFKVENTSPESKNPRYELLYAKGKQVLCFSKCYDDAVNPKQDFAAIMTCSDADENCPAMLGVNLRIATTYRDPKAFDGTPLQDFKYSERCLQIATETLYVFSLVI